MPAPTHARHLEDLRTWRVRPERDITLTGAMGAIRRELKKQQRSLGGVGAAWSDVVPAELAARTTLVSITRGVLTVRVADAPTRFNLDRFLRDGGELALIKKTPATLTRVKLLL